MKATLQSGKHGVVTVDLKAEARHSRTRGAGLADSADGARADSVEPPVLWTEELPPPPQGHDSAGRNER
jgi:hypothetical protein